MQEEITTPTGPTVEATSSKRKEAKFGLASDLSNNVTPAPKNKGARLDLMLSSKCEPGSFIFPRIPLRHHTI
jgi:hypothetical protein